MWLPVGDADFVDRTLVPETALDLAIVGLVDDTNRSLLTNEFTEFRVSQQFVEGDLAVRLGIGPSAGSGTASQTVLIYEAMLFTSDVVVDTSSEGRIAVRRGAGVRFSISLRELKASISANVKCSRPRLMTENPA